MSAFENCLAAASHGMAAEELRTRGETRLCGSVVDVFSSGCYLRFGERVLALGAIPPGPLHIVIDSSSAEDVERSIVGSMRRSNAEIDVSIDLQTSTRWSPPLPTEGGLDDFRKRCRELDAETLIGSDLIDVWDDVRSAGRNAQPTRVLRLLMGRGEGLTPSGDDVIAGLMLIDAWERPSLVATEARVQLIEKMETTRLSESFLRWAARGQSIAPVHRLVDTSAETQTLGFCRAVEELCAIGGSSGRALLAGLVFGIESELALSVL